jgi:hypothetical protein
MIKPRRVMTLSTLRRFRCPVGTSLPGYLIPKLKLYAFEQVGGAPNHPWGKIYSKALQISIKLVKSYCAMQYGPVNEQ